MWQNHIIKSVFCYIVNEVARYFGHICAYVPCDHSIMYNAFILSCCVRFTKLQAILQIVCLVNTPCGNISINKISCKHVFTFLLCCLICLVQLNFIFPLVSFVRFLFASQQIEAPVQQIEAQLKVNTLCCQENVVNANVCTELKQESARYVVNPT